MDAPLRPRRPWLKDVLRGEENRLVDPGALETAGGAEAALSEMGQMCLSCCAIRSADNGLLPETMQYPLGKYSIDGGMRFASLE